MKTFSATPSDIDKKWFVVDADGLVLGRMASIVALRLRGKHKPTYTPHMDTGEYIVVINSEKAVLTGKKLDQRMHYWYTGYPGGLRSVTIRDRMQKKPEDVFRSAVRRMMPKTTSRTLLRLSPQPFRLAMPSGGSSSVEAEWVPV